MEGLLSEKTKLVLEKIIQHCFYINRMADRMVSVLSVKFVMPNTSNIIHKNYAHWAPVYADLISDYMDSRDCTTIYGETPRGDQEYENPLDCINKALEMNIELEKLLKKSIEKIFEIVFNPLTEDGAFKEEYVKQEKENVKRIIEGKPDNKARYAFDRCIEEMYKDKPYGLYKYGYIEDLEKITAQELYDYYEEMKSKCKIDIFVSGNINDEVIKLYNANDIIKNGRTESY